VFEAMLFGPLAKKSENLFLEDDPEAFKYLLSYIYGFGIPCEDIHVVLEVFKLADKYIINDLKNRCTPVIQNLIKPENFKTVYDFTVKYGYNDLKSSCLSFLQQDSKNTKATALLMWFSLNSPKDLLMPVFNVNKLIFDTWRIPKSDEPFNELVTLLESNYWQCNELQEFAGQVSGDIIEFIPGPMRTSVTDRWDLSYAPVLKFSLNSDNAEEVIQALLERYSRYGPEDIGLHITNEDLPSLAGKLSRLPCCCNEDDDKISTEIDSDYEIPIGKVSFYFSDITNDNLHSINRILGDLETLCDKADHRFIYSYLFPKCNLTKEDFHVFSSYIFGDNHALHPNRNRIWISSSNIDKESEETINMFARRNSCCSDCFPLIILVSKDNQIPGW